ncbi:MAG: GHKL domain-containing protein [Sulfurimonas sp.]|nr:GHKL domain-containing protein [Sulfurimonas sp.]
MKLDNFFTSGWSFPKKEMLLRNRYQMVNIALVTSSFAFIYGIIINSLSTLFEFVLLEGILVLVNIILFFVLRRYKNSFESVTMIITLQCTLFLTYIIYTTDVESMKFTWLFTYPIVLLYFQKGNNGIYWLVSMMFLLIMAPIQNFIEVKLTTFEVIYISLVLMILAVIVYFYQIKMNEATDLILQQQKMLLDFNTKLESQVKDKTVELRELNRYLEKKVQDKADELIQKERVISTQSKQAIMGEMISMIAHQWRQPLSTVTLQISNLQLRRLLGEEVNCEVVDKTLSEISNTIIYLSNTIDDFKTYFHPDKESHTIETYELIQKAVNFILTRLQHSSIEILVEKKDKIMISTYENELIQVLMILLNNAVDALESTQREEPKINICVEDSDNKILIFIRDNADGISDDNLPHIFEPYFSTKDKNGTGLGLYMSQAIIEKQFDGKISVETSSSGTTFVVEILKQV